jgi:hypothetical protein
MSKHSRGTCSSAPALPHLNHFCVEHGDIVISEEVRNLSYKRPEWDSAYCMIWHLVEKPLWFFAGFYPEESLESPDNVTPLPWTVERPGSGRRRIDVADWVRVTHIVYGCSPMSAAGSLPDFFPRRSWSDKRQVSYLAVATVLCADKALDALLRNRPFAFSEWIAAAFRHLVLLVEMTASKYPAWVRPVVYTADA